MKRSPAADKFAIPNSESAVALALTALSANTDSKALWILAQFGDPEAARLEQVITKVAELRSTDPKQLIKQNKQKIEDLQNLGTALTALAAALGQDLITKIDQQIAKTKQLAEKAAALSAAKLGQEPVQPVGTPAWRELIAAAIAFNEQAYPGETFPPGLTDARCVLCQQQIGPEARGRLSRFFEVATSDVEAQLATAKAELSSVEKTLDKIITTFFSDQSAARRTLKGLDIVLEVDVQTYVAANESLRQKLVGAIIGLGATNAVPPPDPVSQRIKELSARIANENQNLQQKGPQQMIAELLKEQQLLQDRKLLAGKYTEIADAVADLKWSDKAGTALKGFSGIQREVTAKQKALTKTLVAQGFTDRFSQNCVALGLELPVQFRFTGEAGATDRQIAIANASSGDFEPSDVLSEGEQTAAALADFLTEVELSGTCAGVIFDDPVTSMDHIRKELIAQRLVDEAANRQVIIFTHDILFTDFLATAAKAKGVEFAGRTVAKGDEQEPGRVDLLAFPHEQYEGAAEKRAKDYLAAAQKAKGKQQGDLLEKACGNLRTAYENFIQKRLFYNVVKRWRENISYTLDDVYFDEKIALRVQERLEALSRYIDAHSHSAEHQQVPLTPKLVTEELTLFETIKGDYNAARKTWENAKPKAAFT